MIGFVFSVTYVGLGGETGLITTPAWAAIIFYPGLVAAWWLALFTQTALHINLGYYTYAALGCIVVGLTYAGILAVASFVINRFRYRSRMR